jgi:hypothetical protein
VSKGRWSIRPTQVRKAIEAIKSAGVQIGGVEIAPDGRLRITPKPETVIDAQPTDNRNEWSV